MHRHDRRRKTYFAGGRGRRPLRSALEGYCRAHAGAEMTGPVVAPMPLLGSGEFEPWAPEGERLLPSLAAGDGSVAMVPHWDALGDPVREYFLSRIPPSGVALGIDENTMSALPTGGWCSATDPSLCGQAGTRSGSAPAARCHRKRCSPRLALDRGPSGVASSSRFSIRFSGRRGETSRVTRVVGARGLEPLTSSVSGKRSTGLS